MSGALLKIDGEVSQPLELSFADFEAFPEAAQVRDVSRFHPTRQGANVKFVDRIELTAGRGRDTRPEDDEEHEQLHANES